jgi:fructose-1,6-bisphosphatase/inositol monophosphatase family enzyme
VSTWSRELEVAVEAAKKAAELALQIQPAIVAETKPDKSPVTQADRECERMIAAMLSQAFPDDGILSARGNSQRTALDHRSH